MKPKSKNIANRILLLILVVCVLMNGNFLEMLEFNNIFNISVAATDIGEYCVYFEKPSEWNSKIYTYIYTDGEEIEITNSWPGNIMTNVKNNMYKYEFQSENSNMRIMFNNGGTGELNQYPGRYEPGFTLLNGGYYTKDGFDHFEKTKITNILFDKNVLILDKGKSEILSVTVYPSYTSKDDLEWSTSNSNIAKVSKGKVTAVSTGTVVIFATTGDGIKASCTVKVVEPSKLLTFRTDTNSDKILSCKFEYDDNYFEEKSTVFNQKLAILTLGMVMSGFSSGESDKYWSVGSDTTNDENAVKEAEESRTENISNTYNVLGFDESSIEYYNYDVSLNDASDKVAFSIASKKIHVNGADKTLVAVILRGGGYGSEWSSNFNMGNNGLYHEAFNNAAWEVVNEVIDYLGKKGLTKNVKILMGGFSRAAATANLAAAKLDKLSDSNKLYSISRDDIYTYTFATPQGVVDNNQNDIHNALYDNIFNIINPTDLVPTVALSKWGFGRYGISLTFPYTYYNSLDPRPLHSLISYNRAIKVTSTYNKIVGTNQIIIPALTVNKSTANDLDNSLYKISNNTEVYVQDKYQNIITKALRLRYYDTQTKGSENDRIVRALKEIYSENYSDILLSMYYESEVFVSNFSREIFSDLLGEDKRPLINAILAIISYETGSVDHFISDNIEKSSLMLILKIALFDNAGNLFDNHYPELYLAWLESYDAKELFGKKTYKKITASCPVNVDVYSDNGELLASIVNNEIIKDEIPIYLENDSKEIWLMDGDKYDIKITAYDKGTMTYSVEEYNQDFEMQNKTNFYDVPLKKNSVFETTVSSSAGESVTLYDKDSKKTIYPSETLTKDDEEIEISVSCDSNGHVYGNQNVVKGEYVSVEAVPNDGYIFKGWFKENKLVSKDLEYYFNAIENINLVARFEKIKSVLGDTNGDGKATIADSLMIARYEVKLRTLTDEQLAVSDVNYDGKVTIADALKIARYEVKLIDSL